jgi:methyl-accepting chemotaxis protein
VTRGVSRHAIDNQKKTDVMKNWTIGKRTILGFATIVLIAVVLGAFAFTRLVVIKQGTNRISTDSLPCLLIISEIESVARQNHAAILRYVLKANPGEKANEMAIIQKNIATINKLTNDYAATIAQEKDRELFGNVLDARAAYV